MTRVIEKPREDWVNYVIDKIDTSSSGLENLCETSGESTAIRSVVSFLNGLKNYQKVLNKTSEINQDEIIRISSCLSRNYSYWHSRFKAYPELKDFEEYL